MKQAKFSQAYQEWKKKADKEWFARMKNIEKKVKELEKEEEKKMLEKKKFADLAYKGWLETKENELKKRLKDARYSKRIKDIRSVLDKIRTFS